MTTQDTEKTARKALSQWCGGNFRLGIARIIHQIKLKDEPGLAQITLGPRTLLEARLMPDKAIKFYSPTWQVPGAGEFPYQDPITRELLGQKNTLQIIRKTMAKSIARTMTEQAGRGQVQNVRIEMEAQAFIIAAQEAERNERLPHLQKGLTAAVSHMADPELLRKLYNITQPDRKNILNTGRPTTIWHYASMARLGKDLDQLIQTNPGPLAWLLKTQEDGVAIRHPGQVITIARKSLLDQGLQPESWRTCAQVPTRIMDILFQGNRPKTATGIINTMARAGTIPSPIQARSAVWMMINAESQTPQHPLTMENTRYAIYLLFKTEAPERPALTIDLMDYIFGISQEGRRVTSRTWRGLLRRSQEWHQIEAVRTAERMIQEGEFLEWESLVSTVEQENLQAIPLCNSTDLAMETVMMKHCVAEYTARCQKGESRIFSITQNGRRTATMEINRQQDTWKVHQVRGPMNVEPGDTAKSLARLVAREYTRAWREQEKP